jgi:hypothetical protein
MNHPKELNSSSELVYNLAINNTKICFQGTCTVSYGKCEFMNFCSGNGNCNKKGYCECNQGFALDDCSLAI